ncbi:MAG: polysaccharide deacetylase family protein [Treponema sp.]|jgi:peptidoglycan/xylan/chitin deacetylase (PgdA/CDA1 family)|nr:polysaccharide deacetylase family protein [Treponema sp.]
MRNRAYRACKIFFLLLISLIPVFQLSAVNFSGLTVSNDDRLLFRADFEGQHAVFITRLSDMSMQQLTMHPEKLYLVENGRTIIALNRLGAASIPLSGGLPKPLPVYPSFASGNTPLKGRLQDLAVSADGRWILMIEPISPGYGNLIMVDLSNGAKKIVSEKIELPNQGFPVKWSPDSRLFVYSKGGRLYYFPILSDLSVLVDERFRMIGSGGIESVLWDQQGVFYYLTGNTLYRVTNPELFTRTIYGDFLSIGAVAAVLPLDFDSGFDRYWIAPDSGSILVNKGGKGLFFFLLGENQTSAVSSPAAILPHVLTPSGADNFKVLWPSVEQERRTGSPARPGRSINSGNLTVIYTVQGETYVLRFEVNGRVINLLPNRSFPLAANCALSPDGTKAVFWGENGLELWDYSNWRMIQRLSNSPVFSCAWINDRQLLAGNSRFIEEINISSSSFPRRRICLSSADEYGFEEGSVSQSRIAVRIGNEWFSNDGRNAWTAVSNIKLKQPILYSDRYRVFLEPQASGHYGNIPMIRNMQSTGTLSLVLNYTVNKSYTLGRTMPVALCFDLYDDDTGLSQVLSALSRLNIKATFFLNGEFIRRSPQSASAIVKAGHETGSLFYTPIDLSDTRYRITGEFIARGLARNEDEFHRATGKELSILWHPPFYRSSDSVNLAAAAAGYFTVNRSVDPGDWMSREDALRLNLRQIPPSEMIEQIIIRRESGAVIPIRLGLLPGGRDEYLFQRIEALLDALLRSGYEIVPVSAVIR